MRHPSELFIKFLIVSSYDDDRIIATLDEYGLPPILEEGHKGYLDSLRLDIGTKKPAGFFVGDISDDAIKFLKDIKIYSLVHPDQTTINCLVILDNPQAKREVFLGLLGKVSDRDLAAHICHKFKLDNITDRVLQVFSHYYFNPDLLAIHEWCDLFEKMQSGNDATGYEACLVGGASVASYRIGIEQNITIREVVKEAVTALYVSLQEVKHWPASSSKIKVLSDTVSALAKAHVVINTADQELAAVAAELRQFKLAKNNNKPIPLAVLTKQEKHAHD